MIDDMRTFWAVLGIAVAGAGLLDVFLTALNYDESGFLATRLCRFQWCCLRGVTRHLPRRLRPAALRQVIGLNIVLCMIVWLGTVMAGFGLVYYSQMYGTNFEYSGNHLGGGLFDAMYFSAAQLATVGTSQISPETDVLRAISILETLTGVGLVTLILTFLIGVYQVIRDLRSLSSNFINAGPEFDSPIASLSRYFFRGDPVCLDNHLRAISDSFWSYADGIRQHHLAYYFQSGRNQFSLPYVLHMLGRWLAALRWGLPPGHPATLQPLLIQLCAQFEQFAVYLHRQLRLSDAPAPAAASFEIFSAAYGDDDKIPDLWLGRFLSLNREMSALARPNFVANPQDVYERYQQWLPFAHRAEQLTIAVSQDLDYQPD
jgi:Ion channel